MIFAKDKKNAEQNSLLKKQIDELQSEKQELLKEIEAQKKLNGKLSEKVRLASENSLKEENLLKEQALKRYNEEITRLRFFVERYLCALPQPKERTPESRKRASLALAISEILKDKPFVGSLEEGGEILQKLSDVISGGASESGFNLEEVLNPGSDLDLATLCKELGVMD